MLKKNNERKIFARKRLIRILIVLMSISLVAALVFQILNVHKNQQIKEFSDKSNKKYEPSTEEINYLANRFKELKAVNPETVAYVYAPGTQLDEPVVQTSDNATYLDKTFEGQHEPFMGTVFMDMDNHKDFSDRLTWLFGHARGSKAGDHRMFNDVNYYDRQDYFDKHRYVVIETPFG